MAIVCLPAQALYSSAVTALLSKLCAAEKDSRRHGTNMAIVWSGHCTGIYVKVIIFLRNFWDLWYSCSGCAIMEYRKLGGWKQHKFILPQFPKWPIWSQSISRMRPPLRLSVTSLLAFSQCQVVTIGLDIPWLSAGSLQSRPVLSQAFPMCLCFHIALFLFMEEYQSYWSRAQPDGLILS